MKDVVLNPNAFVVTGGPGAGKTATLEELAALGFPHVPEIARAIIRDEVERSGNALPWGDTSAYTSKMLDGTLRAFENNTGRERPFFFDRGLPDVLCYARLIGLHETKTIEDVCQRFRYNRTVCIAPPWEEIYVTDLERKQTFTEAIATHEAMVKVTESWDTGWWNCRACQGGNGRLSDWCAAQMKNPRIAAEAVETTVAELTSSFS